MINNNTTNILSHRIYKQTNKQTVNNLTYLNLPSPLFTFTRLAIGNLQNEGKIGGNEGKTKVGEGKLNETERMRG